MPQPRFSEEYAVGATPTGLEPATSGVTGRRANQLRYGAIVEINQSFNQLGRKSEDLQYPQRDLNPCYRRERAAS